MQQQDKIRIMELLNLRDQEFQRISDCEQEIHRILNGANFQFPKVVDLPSAKKSAKRNGKLDDSWVDKYHTTLRTLRPECENAYRLDFLNGNKKDFTYHVDKKLLETLLDFDNADFRILKISAGYLQSDEDWRETETIWQNRK